MLRLGNTSLVPPAPRDGFRYADGRSAKPGGQFWFYSPQTDAWIFFGDFNGLTEKVREHLIINKLPVPADLESTVSESICAMTPANWKGCKETERPRVNFVTWGSMKRWLRTMASYAKDRELVSQEEAERRAAICLQCRMMTTEANCKTGGCGGSLAGFLTQLAINRSTPLDEQLHACGVCGCYIPALLHFPNETLDKASAGLSYPEDTRKVTAEGEAVPCWRRETI